MGSASRARPKYLSKKLLQIREALGLSQTEMGRRLGLDDEFARNYVSGYERDTREPTLEVLLRYSEVSGCWMNAIVDDDVELPSNLPHRTMHEGIRRSPTAKSTRRR
ncbi:MAG: helix-turn-helix transcriptional regulator [Acidobacteriota bacterium]|nr:helix-turn-helix transcriptional regulator [Acidobacteriota bacterium]